MRHRKAHRKLNRTSEHRKALRRNQVQSLFEHGQIRTTVPKAKNLRPFAERLITLAKKANQGSLNARRRLHVLMSERSLVPAEHRDDYQAMSDARRKQVMRARSGRRHRTGQPKGRLEFTGESITQRLIETIAPRYQQREGGYTRIIRLADRRVGDQAQLAVLQLVGDEQKPTSLPKPRKSARKVRADARYTAALNAAKSFAKSGAAPTQEQPPAADAPDVAAEDAAESSQGASADEPSGE